MGILPQYSWGHLSLFCFVLFSLQLSMCLSLQGLPMRLTLRAWCWTGRCQVCLWAGWAESRRPSSCSSCLLAAVSLAPSPCVTCACTNPSPSAFFSKRKPRVSSTLPLARANGQGLRRCEQVETMLQRHITACSVANRFATRPQGLRHVSKARRLITAAPAARACSPRTTLQALPISTCIILRGVPCNVHCSVPYDILRHRNRLLRLPSRSLRLPHERAQHELSKSPTVFLRRSTFPCESCCTIPCAVSSRICGASRSNPPRAIARLPHRWKGSCARIIQSVRRSGRTR